MQLTNLTVNRTAENIEKSMVALDIEKARHGVYADTEENRRLHRVGQEYGKSGKSEEPSGREAKKPEEKAGNKPTPKVDEKGGKQSVQKEELFSKNGMLGPDGKLNPKSEHVKRMYDLEKKVDSGKATPEEKREYATLRNQARNESDRHVHEGRKKLGVKEDEPKYKTVDERRAEYKSQREKQEKEASETPEMKAMRKDRTAQHACQLSLYAMSNVMLSNKFRAKMFNENLKDGTPEFISALAETTSASLKFNYGEIAEMADKYGADNLVKMMTEMSTIKDDSGKTVAETPYMDKIAQKIVFDACAESGEKVKAKKEYDSAIKAKVNALKEVKKVASEYAKSAVENYKLSWEPDYGEKITDASEVADQIADALWDVKDINQSGGSQYANAFDLAWETRIANHLDAGAWGHNKMMKMKDHLRGLIENSVQWQEAQVTASIAQAAIDDAKKKLDKYGIDA